MKPGLSTRRGRPRGNGKRHPSSRNQSVESNGPDVKVRGTAQQVLDRYLALARDAHTSGDRVASESYYQHADHYHRLVNGGGQRDQGHGHGQPYGYAHGDSAAPQSPAVNPDAPQPDIGDAAPPEKDPPDNGAGGEEPFRS
ncbi:MAG: DUF4167 domain-containing protein [Rhodospirillales bacterium]|jgi:hypothetical protein|nr:DUF4167 domain-containing protein [Rhodospirillales bacterium]MDP6804502.1 DUF4167 domain-containing protein [Rhodospirillales bacterium]